MTSQEIATQTPQQELVASVRSPEFKEQVALALPEGIKPERFQRVVVTALLDNPDLASADHNSIFQAALHAAKDGLLPDGRQAAFVLFGRKAQYLAMIGGLRKIAAEYGWSLVTRVVYANDEFDFDPVEPKIVHHPVRPGMERGEPIAAYAIAKHKDGRREAEVMTIAEIEKVRAVSKAKNNGPWVDWWERMAEKTVGRRLFAKLPLDEGDRRIASVLEASEPEAEAAVLLYGPDNGKPPAIEAHKPEPSRSGAREGSEGGAAAEDDSSAASAAPADQVAADMEEGFKAPEKTKTDPDVQAADEAGAFPIPRGKYEGKTLREMYEMGDDGVSRIAYVIRNWTEPKDAQLRSSALAFLKVYAPDVYVRITTETAA